MCLHQAFLTDTKRNVPTFHAAMVGRLSKRSAWDEGACVGGCDWEANKILRKLVFFQLKKGYEAFDPTRFLTDLVNNFYKKRRWTCLSLRDQNQRAHHFECQMINCNLLFFNVKIKSLSETSQPHTHLVPCTSLHSTPPLISTCLLSLQQLSQSQSRLYFLDHPKILPSTLKSRPFGEIPTAQTWMFWVFFHASGLILFIMAFNCFIGPHLRENEGPAVCFFFFFGGKFVKFGFSYGYRKTPPVFFFCVRRMWFRCMLFIAFLSVFLLAIEYRKWCGGVVVLLY